MHETRTRKALLMVMSKPGVPPADFEQKFAECAPAPGMSRDGTHQRWARLLGRNDAPAVPHQVFMKTSPPPCDGVIEILKAEDDADLAVAAAAALRRVEPIVSAGGTCALVCDEVRITQGDGPIFVIMVLRRLPHLSHDEFMASWFGRHAAIGEAVEGVRYRQLHVVDNETNSLNAALELASPRIDGIATSYFLTVAEAVQLLSSDAVAVGAIADEKTFIDHASSQFGLYRTLGSGLA